MPASGQMRGMLDVVWFKRDLRVADHAPLAAAWRPVLPLYIIEPDYWRGADASPRQWRFLRGALLDLRAALGEIGLPLVVRSGDAVTLLRRLHALPHWVARRRGGRQQPQQAGPAAAAAVGTGRRLLL